MGDGVVRRISFLGSTMVVLALGLLLAAAAWRRCRAVAVVVIIAMLSRPLLEFTLKALVDRDRPDLERLVPGNGPSFPSGHVMAAVALWGLVPLVVALYTRRPRVWWATVWASAALIVLIGASRTYLGVHWFSDVVGGFVVGCFFLLGVERVLAWRHGRDRCGCARPAIDRCFTRTHTTTVRPSLFRVHRGHPSAVPETPDAGRHGSDAGAAAARSRGPRPSAEPTGRPPAPDVAVCSWRPGSCRLLAGLTGVLVGVGHRRR